MGTDKAKNCPGLKYRKRTNGERVPYWCARPDAVAAGFPIRTANLSDTPADQLPIRCERLWAEMLDYLARRHRPEAFDGTIASAIDLYTRHSESPYHKLQESSRQPYDLYLRKLRQAHGARHVQHVTGLDVITWHKAWRAPLSPGAGPRLAAATVTLAVLKNVLNFAMVCGFKQCAELRQILGLLALPRPQPRTEAPSAADIEKARATAHELGRHGAAFGYALQFEAAMRQWDVIGKWVPLSDPRPSTIAAGAKKWLGPTWANVDSAMILTYTPRKTENTTRKRVHAKLMLLPMVVDELRRIPPEQRKGPLVVNERTGLPYTPEQYRVLWRKVRTHAGLKPSLWNRDMRAGALTEGGEAGASADDRAKLAGHVDERMVRGVYDRDVLVGTERVAEARARFRKGER